MQYRFSRNAIWMQSCNESWRTAGAVLVWPRAARVVVSARRVVFHLASSYPYAERFRAVLMHVMSPALPGRVGIG